jgi:hypothetical protein
VRSVALGNFSWDWIYGLLAARQPSLAESAKRAARAYAAAGLVLELPFAGPLLAFPRRISVGLVARRRVWTPVRRGDGSARRAPPTPDLGGAKRAAEHVFEEVA